jgi:4-amino-4-deoxy-L-arabinose transferase-like glycosyltransferase
MRGRLPRFLSIVVFACAVGHLAWHSFLGPTDVPDYVVGGDNLTGLIGLDPAAKHLYLRHLLFLPQRPRHAWLQILGHDAVAVYVNGRPLAQDENEGFPVGLVCDLTPHLQVGKNVLAISVRQTVYEHAPIVVVDGAYKLSDGLHHLGPEGLWRADDHVERRGFWWFATDFDDRHWVAARRTQCALHAKLSAPPRSVTEPDAGKWITPQSVKEGSAAIRREFSVASRVRQGWLRVTATAPYRLAVNGIPIDESEAELGTMTRPTPVRRAYDITPFLRAGDNVLALSLTSATGPPHILADVEVEDDAGGHVRLGSNAEWQSGAGLPADWRELTVDQSSAWQPCVAESGDLDIPPWQPRRESLVTVLPLPFAAWCVAGELTVIAITALLTTFACRLAGIWLSVVNPGGRRATAGVVYAALVLPTLAVFAGILGVHDPRIARQDVYQPLWLIACIASVFVQWALLALVGPWRRPEESAAPETKRRSAAAALVTTALVAAIFGAGLWLRARDLMSEPLHSDESLHYRVSQGLLERGFPSFHAHKDLPVQYINTAEVVWYGTALSSLVWGDERHAVRMPALLWGSLTTVLIFFVGRSLFGTPAGLIASALYALSPVCIQTAEFGRYYSQLQFFTLLTVYLFWCTLRGAGPIDRRALWLTALSFAAMYLSWEGVGLVVPGMIVAALIQRRGRLKTIFCDPAVWTAMLAVAVLALLQYAHRELCLTQLLNLGTHAADVTLLPMWQYPNFVPWYSVAASTWNRDLLLPLIALAGACVLAVQHRLRRPARFVLLTYLVTCLVLALIFPVKNWRYNYYLVPFSILLTSAALAAVAESVARGRGPALWGWFLRGVAALVIVGAVALGSGMTVRRVHTHAGDLGSPSLWALKFPDVAAGLQYVHDHRQEGDVVFTSTMLQTRAFRDLPVNYWPSTRPGAVAVFDDRRAIPLERYTGTPLLTSFEHLRDVFARGQRIWYVASAGVNAANNEPEVSSFVRQHMDVVYEAHGVMVLLRDNNHRSAAQRAADEKILLDARADFLP